MLTTRRLVVAITFIGVLAMATRVSVDTDTWWHLRAGQWILDHRQIPQSDPFSFTRAGAAWRYPGWLVEAPMYWLWSAAGYAGLNLFTAFFVALAFAFVYRAMEGGEYLRCFVLVLAAAASGVYWSARPQIVSFALAGAFVWALGRWRTRASGNWGVGSSKFAVWSSKFGVWSLEFGTLWLLPPLMVVWANSHGGFAIGFILLALTAAGEAGKALWAREGRRVGWRRVGALAAVGLACAAAVALNPSGPAMLLYPFKTVSIGALRDYVQEWQSPNFHQRQVQPFLWLLFATLAAVGLSGRRMDFTDLLLVSGFGYMAFLAGRNVALFSLAAAPALARHAGIALGEAGKRFGVRLPPRQERVGGAKAVVNGILLGLVALAAGVKMALPLQVKVNEAEVAKQVPLAAAQFIREARPPGPMFNSYNWGGYLTWALYPDYPVFVDGRTDLYDDVFLREYLRAAQGLPGWEVTLARYGVRLVVVEAGSGLDRELGRAPGWREAYRDGLAVVYEKG